MTSEVKDFEAQQKVFDADPNYQLLAIGCGADLFPPAAGAADRSGGEHGAGGIGERYGRGRVTRHRKGDDRPLIELGPAPDLA